MKEFRSGSVYDAWLASACMPPGIIHRLTAIYKTPEACFQAFCHADSDFRQIVTPRYCSVLERNGTDDNLIKMEKLMEVHSVSVLRYDDPFFPETLKTIDDPPAILFYQGNLQCLSNRTLSMVGSRAASYSGQKAARKLSADLSRHGVSIVSGMAYGIDFESHRGCIEGGSPTIAVTACGSDIVYPKENIRLRDDILQNNGLILTEYAPGEKPLGWHFPLRNRIITGLGRALVLIEARIRSGSMTSVQHALEQGKDVFVYPGDPNSEHFEGNHLLLREGGTYFTAAEDILSDLHWLDNPTDVRQNIDCSIDTSNLPPEQASVILALKPGKLSFEKLLEQTRLDPPALMSTLTILQIRGMIESLPGKQYQLKY